MSEVIVYGTEERKNRALILDSKLSESLLNIFINSAELIDQELYKELINPETKEAFKSAKEYFEAKATNIKTAYRYAYIGREILPHLNSNNESTAISLANVGSKKLQQVVKHASEEIPKLLAGGKIVLGNEEYTVEDLKGTSFDTLKEELKKISKKVEKNELLEEQKKNLELEKSALEKELKDEKEFNSKYRNSSEEFDQIDEDLKEASAAWEKTRVLIKRIDSTEIDQRLAHRLKTLIRSIQDGSEVIPNWHMEMLLDLESEDL